MKYNITERSIEENPDKISVITEIGSVKNIKDVQRLMGCLAVLSQFVSWLGECELPLYCLLQWFLVLFLLDDLHCGFTLGTYIL
jgi:hypothetical protein